MSFVNVLKGMFLIYLSVSAQRNLGLIISNLIVIDFYVNFRRVITNIKDEHSKSCCYLLQVYNDLGN